MERLTEKQSEIYSVIKRLISENPCAPTLREIMHELNISSTNGIRPQLASLERKGFIQLDKNTSRGIRLTPRMVGKRVPVLKKNSIHSVSSKKK